MKIRRRYSFVLIEVLIAISLLALCAFPLISQPLFAQKKLREKFFALELDREAEKIYYEILKKPLLLSEILKKGLRKTETSFLEISIEGFGKKTYQTLSSLYYYSQQKNRNGIYKIHLDVSFIDCDNPQTSSSYKFKFVGKKVAEKTPDLYGGGEKNASGK